MQRRDCAGWNGERGILGVVFGSWMGWDGSAGAVRLLILNEVFGNDSVNTGYARS